ncbi:MAG: hypothetical protein IPH12_14010 [Saprospirales bacterium]|nr:hypothetical protein [Saprospirales bacterium]MBK8922848.1 hypothetical protein [Saprospirales bacterium]
MAKLLKDNSCCSASGNGTPTPGGDCIDDWKEKLKEVTNEYNLISAQTDRAEEVYRLAAAWEAKLNTWFANINAANEKALTVVEELGIFIAQVDILCRNSECTAEALELLLCQVKSLFDLFYTYPNQTPSGLKDLVVELKEQIDCLKDLSPTAKEEMLKCIADYEAKLAAVCGLQDAVLKKVVEALKCANLLHTSICSECGLKKYLEDLQTEFAGTPDSDERHAGCPPEESADTTPFPCDETAAKPEPVFPISESDYYKDTATQKDQAITKTQELKEAWLICRKNRDKILARKASLEEAIKAAESAESGK